MKEIKIVVQGDQLKFVTELLDRTGATGYTIINNVSGKGHHGFHEGHLLFNDTSSQVIVFTVVPEDKVEPRRLGTAVQSAFGSHVRHRRGREPPGTLRGQMNAPPEDLLARGRGTGLGHRPARSTPLLRAGYTGPRLRKARPSARPR
jgi:hypothetical protein